MDIYAGEINSKMDSAMAEGLDNLITPIQVTIASKNEIDVEGKWSHWIEYANGAL